MKVRNLPIPRGALLLLMVALVAGGAEAQQRSSRSRSNSTGKAARARAVVRPAQGPQDDGDVNALDGSKIFTGDTDIQGVGQLSLNLGYFLSVADQEFDDSGLKQPLQLARNSHLYVLGASTGLSKDADISLTLVGNQLLDRHSDEPRTPSLQGSAFTGAAIVGRWRLVEDQGDGFSLTIGGGPAYQLSLSSDESGTRYGPYIPGFVSWTQSLVVRQDWAPFSTAAEVFGSLPLTAGPNTFQQYGANLAVGWNAADWILPVAELNYSQALIDGDISTQALGATLGLVLKPNNDSALSLGIQRTLSGRNVENFTTYVMTGSINF